MRLKLIILAAAVAFTASGQTAAAKPEPSPKIEAPAVAPKLDTAKLWRLLATAQQLQKQMEDSEIGKQLADVRAQLQAEQAEAGGQSAGEKGFVLGNADAKSIDAGDIACVTAPPKTELKKGN